MKISAVVYKLAVSVFCIITTEVRISILTTFFFTIVVFTDIIDMFVPTHKFELAVPIFVVSADTCLTHISKAGQMFTRRRSEV